MTPAREATGAAPLPLFLSLGVRMVLLGKTMKEGIIPACIQAHQGNLTSGTALSTFLHKSMASISLCHVCDTE